MPRTGGPCQAPVDNVDGICGHEGVSSTWYGKRGHQFCSSHRAAWLKWRREGGGDEEDEEQPRYLTEMNELLGSRFCDPTTMKADDKFNDVEKTSLHYLVQGTFTAEGYARGVVDTRWQTLQQLTERCSREDFEAQYKSHLKDLEKMFKSAAKRFKKAAELAAE